MKTLKDLVTLDGITPLQYVTWNKEGRLLAIQRREERREAIKKAKEQSLKS